MVAARKRCAARQLCGFCLLPSRPTMQLSTMRVQQHVQPPSLALRTTRCPRGLCGLPSSRPSSEASACVQLRLRCGSVVLGWHPEFVRAWKSRNSEKSLVVAQIPSKAERLLAALRGAAISNVSGPHFRHDEPADFLRGWQHKASRVCDERTLETHLADLTCPRRPGRCCSRKLVLAARAFTVLPTSDDVALHPTHSSGRVSSATSCWPP